MNSDKPGRKATALHDLFEGGVILKAIDGGLEIIGGVLLLLISPSQINQLVVTLTQHELSQDKHDFISNHLLQGAAHLTPGTQLFGVAYLLSHGIIKVGLAAGLLKKQRWAYPATMAILGLFIMYQIYRITLTHSWSLVLLTVFDAAIIGLTWHEYWRLKNDLLA